MAFTLSCFRIFLAFFVFFELVVFALGVAFLGVVLHAAAYALVGEIAVVTNGTTSSGSLSFTTTFAFRPCLRKRACRRRADLVMRREMVRCPHKWRAVTCDKACAVRDEVRVPFVVAVSVCLLLPFL